MNIRPAPNASRRFWSTVLSGFLYAGMSSSALAQVCQPPVGHAVPFIWPLSGSTDGLNSLDRINSPFGPRIRASTSSYEFHEGIDLAGPNGSEVQIGDPVFAGASGRVSFLTDDAGCSIRIANETNPDPNCTRYYRGGGRIVRLDHGNNLFSLYLHLSRQADGLRTDRVVQVQAGDPVGAIGMTGEHASIPHLHFEVRDGGTSRDCARNALGYLPRTVNLAPVITALSITPAGDTARVSVTIEHDGSACERPDCDLDLNQIVLRVWDRDGTEIADGARAVDFNERMNVAYESPEINGITMVPEPFSRRPEQSAYRLTAVFDALPLIPSGSYEITALDVFLLSASDRVVAP